MPTITKRLSVDQYDLMVKHGILPETNRFEMINGRIVEKEVKDPAHSTVVHLTRQAVERVLPMNWFVRQEQPLRIPNRRSEPEPDLAVVRGSTRTYATRHTGPEDVALVVEVTRSTIAKDRVLVRVYGGVASRPAGSSTRRSAGSKCTKDRSRGSTRRRGSLVLTRRSRNQKG